MVKKIKKVLDATQAVIVDYYAYKSGTPQEKLRIPVDKLKQRVQTSNLTRKDELITLCDFYLNITQAIQALDSASCAKQVLSLFQFLQRFTQKTEPGIARTLVSKVGLANEDPYLKTLINDKILTQHEADDVIEACELLALEKIRRQPVKTQNEQLPQQYAELVQRYEKLRALYKKATQQQHDTVRHLVSYSNAVLGQKKKAYSLPSEREAMLALTQEIFAQVKPKATPSEVSALLKSHQEQIKCYFQHVVIRFGQREPLTAETLSLLFGVPHEQTPAAVQGLFNQERISLADLIDYAQQKTDVLNMLQQDQHIFDAFRQGAKQTTSRDTQLQDLVFIQECQARLVKK